MRRDTLAPPRRLTPQAATAEPLARPDAPDAGHAAAAPAPPRDPLSRPEPAIKRRRPLFHPKTGWFRKLERQASHWLSRGIYPWIPGIHLPYDRVLSRGLRLSVAEIELPGLPPEFDGISLLLISDLHAGPFVSPRVLYRAVERLQALEPDLIVIAGDLTSSHVAEFDSHREAFELLAAPLGVFAVLGNHDHYTDEPDRLCRMVEESGIRMLQNRSVRLERQEAGLSLAGVDDMLMGRPDLGQALAGTTGPVILVSHHPDLLFDAAARGVSLMLSGHTHGGQIRLPGLPVLVRQSRYRLDQGRYRVERTELVVSRGLGAVGVPWRAWCPPEGVLLRLRRRAADAAG